VNKEETKKKLIEFGVDASYMDDDNHMPWDLSEEMLLGMDLSGADLSGVDLYGANLQGTNLQGADLSNSDLRKAVPSWANLSDANLKGAILEGVGHLTAHQLAQAKNLEYAYLDPGRYADAVAAGYKPEPSKE